MNCIKKYEYIQYKIGDIMIVLSFLSFLILFIYKYLRQETIENYEIILVMLMGINFLFLPLFYMYKYFTSFLTKRNKEKIIIIEHGIVNFNNLVSLNYSLEKLFEEVKKAGFNSFDEVNYAILCDGILSFSN